VGRFISDVVLQVLSFVAENERANIKERQAEGIRLAKQRGVRFGRPRKPLPPSLGEILGAYEAHALTEREAAERIGVSRTTFFRLVSEEKKATRQGLPESAGLPIPSLSKK